MSDTKDNILWDHFVHDPDGEMAVCTLCGLVLKSRHIYNLKLHLRNVHNDKKWSLVRQYCDINIKDNTVVCKICQHKQINRLCNIKIHLRRAHGIEIEVPNVARRKSPPPTPPPIDIEQTPIVIATSKRQIEEKPTSSKKKRPKNGLLINIDKRRLMCALIGLIVEEDLNPQLLYSKPFKKVLRAICKGITEKEGTLFKINEEAIGKALNMIENYIRTEFSNDLQSRLLSIKIDTDLNAAPNTFCVSARFIQDGEIQTPILGLIRLKGESQFNDEHLRQILYKFNIDSNQIISIFWDNTKQDHNKYIENSEYLKEIEQFSYYPDISLGDVKVERYLGSSAQLCLLDIFKNSSILERFLECRKMVKFIGNIANGYYDLLKERNLNIPQLDSPWKYGSTYKMMQDLHDAREIFKNFKFEQPNQPEDQFSNNADLWSFIDAFCKALTYLQRSILKFYTEDMHIGDLYAQWLKCKLLTQKLQTTNKENKDISMIVEEVLKAFQKRSTELFNQKRFVAVIFLDPRFQRTLSTEQRLNAAKYLKSLWSRAKLYVVDEPKAIEEDQELLNNAENSLLNEFLCHDAQVKATGTSCVNGKIENLKLAFKAVDTNIIAYWQNQKKTEPELQALSTICFAIPATQIYDKLLYSYVLKLDVDSKFSHFTNENLLFIRLNVQHLNAALAHVQLFQDDRLNSPITGDDNSTESTITANFGQ